MDAHALRAITRRCRDLYLIAVKPETKAQLREWIADFEAEAMERERHRRAERQRKRIAQPRLVAS